MSPRSLYHDWQELQSTALDPSKAWRLAKKANGAGEHLLAIEIAEAALATNPETEARQLLQQKALALARMGSTQRALEAVEKLRAEGAVDADTWGLLGRIYKDLAEGADTAAERRKWQQESQRHYGEGFALTQSPFNGINAAALAVFLGEVETAQRLAQETLDAPQESDPYYSTATQAEANLILKNEQKAAELYAKASAAVGERWADLASTRKQCRALALKLYGRRDQFDAAFPPGVVAVFAGHMFDLPKRRLPRFPETCQEGVRERIRAWIKDNGIRFSFSSAASGADLIFLSEARAAGVETHLVLPFRAADFIETSLRPRGDHWVAEFEQAHEQAASVTIVSDDVVDEQTTLFDYGNRIVAARAALRAKALDLPLRGLAVWNGKPGDNRGGTADAVGCWCRAKIETRVLDPEDPAKDAIAQEETTTAPKPFSRVSNALPGGYQTGVCAILHVYFASYFALREAQRIEFQREIVGAMARSLAESKYPPVSRCGLGPDYVFVFDAMRPAGLVAQELLTAVAAGAQALKDWNIEPPRMCLHAGLVQVMVNPVLNQYVHEGATLTRAGRVVRQSTPGTAYCTEAFASLCALESIREFQFERVGTVRYGDEHDRLFSLRFR